MANKYKPANPGLFEILFGVALSLFLGALLAILHLVFRPVEVVSAMPAEPVADVRYTLSGANGSGAGTRWKIKIKRLGEKFEGDYAFTEAELNAWADSTFKKAELPEGNTPSFALLAGVPNFKFDDGELKIITTNDLLLLGGVSKVVVETKGTIVKGDEGWKFAPSSFYLGGLPSHKMPFLTSMLVSRFSKTNAVTPELANVMANAKEIGFDGKSLVVKVP